MSIAKKTEGKWTNVTKVAKTNKETRRFSKIGGTTPYRKPTTKELIKQNYPDYDIKEDNGNYIVTAKPQEYKQEYRKGGYKKYATYSPHELIIGKDGTIKEETKFSTYKADASKSSYRREVYKQEYTNYGTGYQKIQGKREVGNNGRETIRT